jgi:sulfur dioxygenase
MNVKQIRSVDGTGTLSYIVYDEKNKVGAVVDPNIEDVQKLGYMIDELEINVTHIFDTHTHADHISGAASLKQFFSDVNIIMHETTKNKFEVLKHAAKFGIEDILEANAKIEVDKYVNDGDEIKIGDLTFKILHTPGHTDNHISLLADDAVFTGDLLLIGQAGRSDLPGGNPKDQYDSLFNKIKTLPNYTKIYPGHDYEDNEYSILQDELKNNPFLEKRSKEQYVEFVKDFFPPAAEAVAADGKMTLQCGTKRVVENKNEFRNISSLQLSQMLNENEDLFLLDVREPFELITLGKINGVVNIPVGELTARIDEVPNDESQGVVCICASGNRSYEVAHYLVKKGYKNVMNLEGGTYGWLTGGYQAAKAS